MSKLRQEIEREYVRRLLAMLGRPTADLESPDPPAPDVRATTLADGSIEMFEVTEIHPDEVPDQGSAARAVEEQHARMDPHAVNPAKATPAAMPAIHCRVEQKVKKAAGYLVQPNESLSLLLVGSVPKSGALMSTLVSPPSLSIEQLNGELGELLAKSRFQRAYLYLLLPKWMWGWSRPGGWHVLREPQDPAQEGPEEMHDSLESRSGLGPNMILEDPQNFGRQRP